MTNDGNGTAWVETDPADNAEVRLGAREIRDIRVGVRKRLEKEHTTPAGSTAGGEHKPGSAVVYTGAAEPTQRPDEASVLTIADKGRIWIDDNDVLYYFDGTDFKEIIATDIEDDTIGTAKIVDGSVTLAKMASNSVDTSQIIDKAVTQAKLADDSVGEDQLIDGEVTVAKLAAGVYQPMVIKTYTGVGTNTEVTGFGFEPNVIRVQQRNNHRSGWAFKGDGTSSLSNFYSDSSTGAPGSDFINAVEWGADGVKFLTNNNHFSDSSSTYLIMAFRV